MNRRFPPSVYRLRSYNSSPSFNSISTPLPVPKSHPHFRPSPSPTPLEKLINDYKKSLPRFNTPTPTSPPEKIPIQNKHSDDSPLDSEEYVNLVHRYTGSFNPEDAKHLHCQLFKKGFIEDLFLSNTLINMYAKIGNLISAHQLFDEMPHRNAVSWTCLISGYMRQGLPDEACTLFRSMLGEGFAPTHFSLGSVLRACQESGSFKFGMQIHALISKTRHVLDVVVCNALISMYGICCISSADYARQVFDGMLTKNSISWNSIISAYSQRGNFFSAFGLFLAMQREDGLKPNEYTYGSLITAIYSYYSSSGFLGSCVLDQMLSRTMKSGYLSDLYVGSALVSAFARFGLLDNAREIFEQMSERNVVSVNGLMVGLVKQRRGEEAVEVFRETRDLIGRNCDSYVVLLSACADFVVPKEGRKKGREIHGFVVKVGLIDYRLAIKNGLINMYAKCGAIDDAYRVFKLMGVKDLVSWNSIISGLDQNGCFDGALSSYRGMRRSGLVPSNFTLISTLSSCASLGFITLGRLAHCEGIKSGLDSDISVSNSLLAFYAVSGSITDCHKVFSLMDEYDRVSWNTMIGALAGSEVAIIEAIEAFMDMLRAGWGPNRVTFINILAALSSLSFLELGRQVHALVLKYCVSSDNAVENALLSCYAKCGEMDECERVFLKMSDRRDEVSWNSMISGYIHNGFLPKAMDFLWFMMQKGQKMDCFTYASVLSACASIAALQRGMELHARGIRACLGSDVVVESALVDMYSKCGRIDYASTIFGLMPLRNEFSWNSMISGYARHGHGELALELFKEMEHLDQKPDHVTFVGVLSACSHVGLLDQGFKYFESMAKNYGIIPRMEHYSCMVDLLARAGELDKVEEFVKRMPIKPNALVWRTVLGACSRANVGNMEFGKQAAELLLELEPQNPVNYVLISNMYASKGGWEDVSKARAAMRGVSVKKEAGCSWVTMKDGVHVFVAGDRSHPETDEIYAELQVLNQKMRDAGYVPQTKFALYDLEVESKEELLSYHSEKLAVAFVLTRTSGLPIRIMKNLRICGDCHSAFGYISKIVARQIILRDSSRFHHFNDGKCSCQNYW
ncbi:tetratricopeptide repeat (TPR)-like superfamily protein [Tasmannia lanceolata]|uniref:tetratricopeptide repeat (TPR)-like superfamily protein n=1 Tax=Tasmannia lanceolata TaxID=3420 RepID=UPI0040646CF1